MPFRFFRRKKLFPGVTLNISKSGPSLSIGPRGFTHTIGPRGRRTTVGLPGTGLHYTTHHKTRSRNKGSAPSTPEEPAAYGDSPTAEQIGEVDAARARAEEDRTLLRAIISFQSGQDDAALQSLERICDLADARWLSGLVHMRAQRWAEARAAFEEALSAPARLGSRFAANGVNATIEFAITPEIFASIAPNVHATRLVLAEACQAQGDLAASARTLTLAMEEDPEDPVLAISLAEVALEAEEAGTAVIALAELAPYLERTAENPVIAASLALYRARLAARLGKHAEAIGYYALAEKRAAHDDEGDLFKTAWYERALCHADSGDRVRCHQELSALYARDPEFADVRTLLI